MNNFFQPNDRFVKLRLGEIIEIIRDKTTNEYVGEINVRWIDGEPGGQSKIPIVYPCYSVYENGSETNKWGLECGFDVGMIGIFGFLTDNHAVLLGTVLPKATGDKIGYNKTDKIRPGEFRITSKSGAKIYLDDLGEITVVSGSGASVILNLNGEVSINDKSGSSILLDRLGDIEITSKRNINVKSSGTVNVDAKSILMGGHKSVVVTDQPGDTLITSFEGLSTSSILKGL